MDRPSLHRSAFLKAIKSTFPELSADIHQQKGLIGFEIQVLRQAADRAIHDGDTDRLQALAALVEVGLQRGNQQLRAALLAFFVDDLDVVGRHAWAMACLPKTVAFERRRRINERGVPI